MTVIQFTYGSRFTVTSDYSSLYIFLLCSFPFLVFLIHMNQIAKSYIKNHLSRLSREGNSSSARTISHWRPRQDNQGEMNTVSIIEDGYEKVIFVGTDDRSLGDGLRKCVDAERARERDEKLAKREATKEKLEAERALAECERERLALEQQTLHLKLRLAEVGQKEMEAEVSRTSREERGSTSANVMISPHKFILVFDEKRDDLEAYSQRFERIAACQEWPQDKWTKALSMCLRDEAFCVFGRLSSTDSLNY